MKFLSALEKIVFELLFHLAATFAVLAVAHGFFRWLFKW